MSFVARVPDLWERARGSPGVRSRAKTPNPQIHESTSPVVNLCGKRKEIPAFWPDLWPDSLTSPGAHKSGGQAPRGASRGASRGGPGRSEEKEEKEENEKQ